MSEKIFFMGRVYRSVSEMEPDTRQLFEKLESFLRDQNRDGVPDVMQEGGLGAIKEAIKFMREISSMSQGGKSLTQEQMAIIRETDTTISVNGRTFRGVEEMPLEVRRIYQRVVGKASAATPVTTSEGGIYDEPWRDRDRDSYFKPHDDELIEPSYRQPPTQSVMQPVTSNAGLVIAAVLVIIFIAIGAVIWLSNPGIF